MGHTYRVMLTSLYGGGSKDKVEYYYVNDGKRCMYCDAMLSAEASSKYILANHRIDEIVILGSNSTYDPGDELVQMVLREGSSFYASDIGELSTYSLLRYRLAQYIDEIRIEEQDLRDLLSEEEQERFTDLLRDFYRDRVQRQKDAKFNRLFDVLMQDPELSNALLDEIRRFSDGDKGLMRRCIKWSGNYLYEELKETHKLELLEGNENVRIRFIPAEAGSSLDFADKLNGGLMEIAREHGDLTDIEFYICIQSEDASDTFALMNFMDIAKSMPGNRIRIRKIATSTHAINGFSNRISDDTDLYGVSDLLAGTRAFLQYGKTDLMFEYRKKQKTENEYIDRLLYAMRNIDYGISLCDTADIERGINSLRQLFSEGDFVPADMSERYFDLIIEAIKQDYGVLVSGDRIEFIDLVKWAYRKGFWQQTLTLIESKAPADFVERGIYYYADSDESKEKALRVLAGIYNDLKSFEKYKLDHVEHYFVKFYGRDRADRAFDSDSRQQKYVRLRMGDLDRNDPEIIRALTACPDREALGSLLYTYYMVGIVRNETNHAADDETNEFTSKPADSDVSERMGMIKQSVENFIDRYERVVSLVPEDASGVRLITNSEIRALASTMKPRFDNKKDGRPHERDGKREDNKDGSAEKSKNKDR